MNKSVLSIFFALLALAAFISPSFAGGKIAVYRKSSEVTYSKQLGVNTMPAWVIMDGSRRDGLYISSKATLELGRSMGLCPGMVILDVDGHSMPDGGSLDAWLKEHRQGNLQYTYYMMSAPQQGLRRASVRLDGLKIEPSSSRTAMMLVGRESDDELQALSIKLINQSRRSEGLSVLSVDSSLSNLAKKYANYMGQNAAGYELAVSRSPHLDLQGRGPEDRARDAGISAPVFENIGRASRGFAQDSSIVSTIHQQMMAEPAGLRNHRGNIMDPDAKSVGVGIMRSSNRFYMAQEFSH
ncbi:MAG: hypothetical protein K2X27_03740 [Candidatus Obscuribacterales bacterium]|nr:hypothetical protein [Candidatus Obscuribacterales bacterium]